MINPALKLYEAFYRRKYAKTAALSAARIQAVSESLISGITARKLQSLDKGPVFAVIGETHDLPMHSLILMKTVLGLKKKGFSINVGFEMPHNFPEHLISQIEKGPSVRTWLNEASKKLLATVKDHDFDDPRRVYVINCLTQARDALHTNAYVNGEFFDHKIKCAMNDAARLYDDADSPARYKMDFKDPAIQEFLTDEERKEDSAAIFIADHRGMSLRNQVMVKKAREHAAIRQPDIYLQYCGSEHVAGNANTEDGDPQPYEKSLLGLFNQAGCSALGFILGCNYSSEAVHIPPEADASTVSKIAADDIRAPSWLAAREKVWLESILPHL